MLATPIMTAPKRKQSSGHQAIASSSYRASAHWSTQEDELLQRARARGGHWQDISKNFPGKSSNACRKRHERLMEKLKMTEWDEGVQLERLATAYWEVREEMWSLLADKLGEKWQKVEEKCMDKGLHNLKTAARIHKKEGRRAPEGMDDDSGVCLSETEPSPELSAPAYSHGYINHHPHQNRLPPLSRTMAYSTGPTIASMLAPSGP